MELILGCKSVFDWITGKSKKPKSKHGAMTVQHEGDAIFVVDFKPELVKAYFSDRDPPIDSCSRHCPDNIDTTIMDLSGLLDFGHNRWGIKISWRVATTRHVVYEILG